jgi:hypothetical protein
VLARSLQRSFELVKAKAGLAGLCRAVWCGGVPALTAVSHGAAAMSGGSIASTSGAGAAPPVTWALALRSRRVRCASVKSIAFFKFHLPGVPSRVAVRACALWRGMRSATIVENRRGVSGTRGRERARTMDENPIFRSAHVV